MNKAFIREPDPSTPHCPRCGSLGQPVGPATLDAQLPAIVRALVAESAYFCPFSQCDVVYFDEFERCVLIESVGRPVYPKDPDAPICGCFGLTREGIEQDVREGVVTRTRAVVEKAKSPEAHCTTQAFNGRPCLAEVQGYYMKCRGK